MPPPTEPHLCRICGLDKGGVDKQACNYCWSLMSHAGKIKWYEAATDGTLTRYAERIVRGAL